MSTKTDSRQKPDVRVGQLWHSRVRAGDPVDIIVLVISELGHSSENHLFLCQFIQFDINEQEAFSPPETRQLDARWIHEWAELISEGPS